MWRGLIQAVYVVESGGREEEEIVRPEAVFAGTPVKRGDGGGITYGAGLV